jgi:hypothetical protein
LIQYVAIEQLRFVHGNRLRETKQHTTKHNTTHDVASQHTIGVLSIDTKQPSANRSVAFDVETDNTARYPYYFLIFGVLMTMEEIKTHIPFHSQLDLEFQEYLMIEPIIDLFLKTKKQDFQYQYNRKTTLKICV